MRLRLINRSEGSAVVVCLSGEVDVHTAPLLRRTLACLVREGHCRIVLDLSELAFMDSTGLAVLVGIWQRVRQADGSLALAATPARIQRLFHLTRLDLAFRMYDTVPEAITATQP